MRARLAGGQNGGVNSPEGASKITEELVAPRTQETADGGAEPIAPSSTDAEPASGESAPAAKRKRRTKAEMEAAAASAASTTLSASGPPAPTAETVADSVAVGSDLARIADALERIAKAMELAAATEPF